MTNRDGGDEPEQGAPAQAEHKPHSHTPGKPHDVQEARHPQDKEKQHAEDEDWTWLKQ
jgi:hypothetical protein